MSTTLIIIFITLAITYYGFKDGDFFERYAHAPFLVKEQKQFDRWLTSGFLHADWIHFGINMFVLWSFGTQVENIFVANFGFGAGNFIYLLIYFVILIASSIPTYIKYQSDPRYYSIGASGAVSGILFSYILFYPLRPLWLYGIIPIPGLVAGLAYLIYSNYAAKRNADRINHDAHFYGALAGILLTFVLMPESIILFYKQLYNFLM